MLCAPPIADNQHTALNQQNSKYSFLNGHITTLGIPTRFKPQGIIILQRSVSVLLLYSFTLA